MYVNNYGIVKTNFTLKLLHTYNYNNKCIS